MVRSSSRGRGAAPTRRELVAGSLAAGAVAALPSAARAADTVLDDASNLNATPVARHIVVKAGGEAQTI